MGFQGPTQDDTIANAAQVSWTAVVKVEGLNDHGERREVVGTGRDSNEAVRNAIDRLIDETGDDSWCMNEWGPA